MSNDNWDKRSPTGLIVGSTILSGVFGTLMGWFTHRRLTNLQEQVNEVKNEQHLNIDYSFDHQMSLINS